MSDPINDRRRRFLGATVAGVASVPLAISGRPALGQAAGASNTIGTSSAPGASTPLKRLEPLKHVEAGVLNIAYYETGPAQGPVAVLMHGFPYDIHSYADVAPMLAARGMRVIVPYLRGFGPTRFLDPGTPRSGQQAAMGADLIALMDALKIARAVVGGYDWGGRGACVVAAIHPERCIGLVCVNSYLILNIARLQEPSPPRPGAWYQYYLHSELSRQGLDKYRREFARTLWTQWSPNWKFDDATFERTAAAFDNPDFVEVVIHSYRHRFGLAPGDPRYAELEARLAATPPITVPAITLDSGADGAIPPTDGTPTAARFTNRRIHRVVPGAGHNLPQEAPRAFADAVAELVEG